MFRNTFLLLEFALTLSVSPVFADLRTEFNFYEDRRDELTNCLMQRKKEAVVNMAGTLVLFGKNNTLYVVGDGLTDESGRCPDWKEEGKIGEVMIEKYSWGVVRQQYTVENEELCSYYSQQGYGQSSPSIERRCYKIYQPGTGPWQ